MRSFDHERFLFAELRVFDFEIVVVLSDRLESTILENLSFTNYR